MHTVCQKNAFTLLYQDAYLVAIHKPAGLLVHRSPIDKHETEFALQYTRDAIGQKVYAIHRLDKATSGILLFALDPQTARLMADQFSHHTIEKTYWAICRGWANEQGYIDHALKYQQDKIADKVKPDRLEPQSAQTAYRTLATTQVSHTMGRYDQQRYCLIEMQPKTGRKHQLRRHMNHIKHPIIGDVKHGDRHHNHFFYERIGHHRLYLAAIRLRFIHPIENRPVTIEAPLQENFQATLNTFMLTIN